MKGVESFFSPKTLGKNQDISQVYKSGVERSGYDRSAFDKSAIDKSGNGDPKESNKKSLDEFANNMRKTDDIVYGTKDVDDAQKSRMRKLKMRKSITLDTDHLSTIMKNVSKVPPVLTVTQTSVTPVKLKKAETNEDRLKSQSSLEDFIRRNSGLSVLAKK